MRLLVLAPSRRAYSETFVRNNIRKLPFHTHAYFGDEYFSTSPLACAYGLSVFLSKILTRLGCLQLATLPASLVATLLIYRHRPDAVMVEFGFHAVRIMESARVGIPLLVHFRGSDASANRYIKVLSQRYRRLFSLTSGILVKNAIMRDRLIELGANSDQIIISPSGADEKLFYGATPGQNQAHFLSVGRFVAKKGPLETLEAFARMRSLLDSNFPSSLEMVGDGPLLKACLERAVELDIETYVTFSGPLSPTSVAKAMRRARAFVQHSKRAQDGDEEGCPVSIMEAQLSGLPVVSTIHAGIPDVVIEGNTGFLVAEGDVKGMSEAMAVLAQDSELAAQLGESASYRARSRFTVNHHLDQISGLIRSISRNR